MTETQFIEQNQERWKQLEAFNQTLQRRGIRTLSRLEVRAFAETFRAVGYHLAYAKTHFPGGTSLPYLSHIVGVAHNYYYVRERKYAVRDYFSRRFPAACRRASLYALVSAVLFMAGMIFAYSYVIADIERFPQIFPFDMAGLGEGVTEASVEENGDEAFWNYPLMSAIIMTNNIRVAIMAFAFGVSAGIGTVWILFYNGLIVGSLAAFVVMTGGSAIEFWSLILPHGVAELIAIFLSGACGLMIGRAIIMPGNYSRRDAVVKAAREAVELVPGIVVILILAALIEGFFTPLDISPYFKLAFAFLSFVGLGVYFVRR